MEIGIIKVGELRTNCYILSLNHKALIIDPGDEPNKIVNYLEDNQLELIGILITHHHFDHVGALDDLLLYKDVKVYDVSNLKEEKYNIQDFNFEVVYTKGHTNDSITYYFNEDDIMFVGDFIFKGSIGRTDLPTGSDIEMMNSIKKIKTYKDNITLYPGHGDNTILGIEKKTNPYFI